MKRTSLATIILFSSSVALNAQSTHSLSADVKTGYTTVKNNLLGAAQKMPEENYGFKPTPDIRSFAEVLNHAASSQMRTCASVLGEQKSVNAEGTTKADVLAALNASFAECDKAYDGITDANVMDTIQTPRGERSRIGALAANIVHDTEQYGILSVYLRLKGVIPPSSEPAGRKK